MIGCLFALLALGAPRIVLLLLEFGRDHYVTSVFQEKGWALLGFLFAPLTVLAWAWSMHAYGGIKDTGLIVVIIAAIIDSGLVGSQARQARRRRRLKREQAATKS
jgi:predicted membrane protein